MPSSSHPIADTMSPPRQSASPTKKVTLKLTVNDVDLSAGRFRQNISPVPTLLRSSTSKSARGSTPRRKAKRRRPPETSFTRIADRYDENEEEEPEDQLHDPSDPRFCSVSMLSFPLLVSTASPSRPQQPNAHTQAQPTRRRRHCACCGAPESASSTSSTWQKPAPRTPDPPGSVSPAHHPTSSHGELKPRHLTNVDAHSPPDLLILRSGPVPQTVEFWYDLTIAEQARQSQDVDFKMMCLKLMRWRMENDTLREVGAFSVGETLGKCQRAWLKGRSVELVRKTVWEELLDGVRMKARLWRKMRRWREGECEKVAGWVVWESRQWSGSRGGFVADESGAWVVREPGIYGCVRSILQLGYRRQKLCGSLHNEDLDYSHVQQSDEEVCRQRSRSSLDREGCLGGEAVDGTTVDGEVDTGN